MRIGLDRAAPATMSDGAKRATCITLLGSSSVLFSLALACATPFAALAAVAATQMSRRDSLMLVGFAWLANQAIGFLFLGYPQTWDSFGWGVAIGFAALLASEAAAWTGRLRASSGVRLGAALIAAFVLYEAALLSATAILPSGDGAFSITVVGRLFAINALALIGLSALHRGAAAIGIIPGTRSASASA